MPEEVLALFLSQEIRLQQALSEPHQSANVADK